MPVDNQIYERELKRLWEDCPSEMQEACELGHPCLCHARANQAVHTKSLAGPSWDELSSVPPESW